MFMYVALIAAVCSAVGFLVVTLLQRIQIVDLRNGLAQAESKLFQAERKAKFISRINDLIDHLLGNSFGAHTRAECHAVMEIMLKVRSLPSEINQFNEIQWILDEIASAFSCVEDSQLRGSLLATLEYAMCQLYAPRYPSNYLKTVIEKTQ